MRTVEVVGGLSVDHLVTVMEPPQWYVTGGPGFYGSLGAATCARALVRERGEKVNVALRAVVPDQAVAVLEAARVDLTNATVGEVPILWILNSPQGRRIIPTAAPDSSHELDQTGTVSRPQELPPADIQADAVLYSAPRRIASKRAGQIVCVDPDQEEIARLGWNYFETLAANTGVFLPSRTQLSQLGDDPLEAAKELRARTGRAVVARLDREGTLVLPPNGGVWAVSAGDVDVVDTTGAGDSHAGAFAAAITNAEEAENLVDAALWATAVAAQTISGSGADRLANAEVSPAELQDLRAFEYLDEQARNEPRQGIQ